MGDAHPALRWRAISSKLESDPDQDREGTARTALLSKPQHNDATRFTSQRQIRTLLRYRHQARGTSNLRQVKGWIVRGYTVNKRAYSFYNGLKICVPGVLAKLRIITRIFFLFAYFSLTNACSCSPFQLSTHFNLQLDLAVRRRA